MPDLPKKLRSKLASREADNALRTLSRETDLIDFSSNDYLGFAKDQRIHDLALKLISQGKKNQNGATGSRLLSGNHGLYEKAENLLSQFHDVASALIFNSGYDANVGFFSSVPQKGDVVLYDELIHASIRDGIRLSRAESVKFKHNDLEDLQIKCKAQIDRTEDSQIYIVTESVFSMDGDSPDLITLVEICAVKNYHLVVDEAHAMGVYGENGEGLVQYLNLHKGVFARIVTYGKALGCHGAAILASEELKNYLINFARSLIYTTGLPPHSIASIIAAYEHLPSSKEVRKKLENNIEHLNRELKRFRLETFFIPSSSAVHCCLLPGNEYVVSIAEKLQEEGFNVMPIRYPSVKVGEERLRFCIHSFNTKEEISGMLKLLAKFI